MSLILGRYNERVALTTVPVFVFESNKVCLNSVFNFGSGFFICYRDLFFFITVDHVVHYSDFNEGFRSNIDYTPWVYCSFIRSDKLSLMIPMLQSTFFSSANFQDICQNYPHRLGDGIENLANPSLAAFEDNELASVAIPDLHDIAFANIPPMILKNVYSFLYPYRYDWRIPLRLERIQVIHECEFGDIKEDKVYHTGGFTNNHISTTGEYHCVFRFLTNLSFLRRQEKSATNPDELIWLNCPEIFTEKELVGISGAPLFDENEHLCGIVCRTQHRDHSIAIFPLQPLLHLIDYEININLTLMAKTPSE